MDSNLVHSLAQAIGILFGNEAGWTQEQKHKANTFILEANNRKDVFPALLTILMDQSYSLIIQFFACNLLNDKLRKQWGQLLVQEQSEVVDRLGHLVLHTLPNLMSHSSEATVRDEYNLLICIASQSARCRLIGEGLFLRSAPRVCDPLLV